MPNTTSLVLWTLALPGSQLTLFLPLPSSDMTALPGALSPWQRCPLPFPSNWPGRNGSGTWSETAYWVLVCRGSSPHPKKESHFVSCPLPTTPTGCWNSLSCLPLLRPFLMEAVEMLPGVHQETGELQSSQTAGNCSIRAPLSRVLCPSSCCWAS